MNYHEAIGHLESGAKIRLPEWTGYWFQKDGKLLVYTRTGAILDTPDLQHVARTDWELVKTEGLGFDFAVLALKAGNRVCRKGWNGKGMWLTLINPGNAMHISSAGGFPMQPCIGMKTADHNMQPGWLASQADILATDWVIAE